MPPLQRQWYVECHSESPPRMYGPWDKQTDADLIRQGMLMVLNHHVHLCYTEAQTFVKWHDESWMAGKVVQRHESGMRRVLTVTHTNL